MNVFIVCIGSYGDFHPLLGIGVTLKNRGHAVTILANSYFELNSRRAGLDFHAIGTLDDYQAMLKNPELVKTVCDTSLRPMKPVFNYISEHFIPGESIVVCNASASLGARLAHEKFDIPYITINLMPMTFGSAYEPPIFTFHQYPSWWPRWVFKGGLQLVRFIYDLFWRKPLNEFRKEIGMPRQPRNVIQWMLSPQKIISLFPEWFAKPQPDWPAQNELTGFPAFDSDPGMPEKLPEGLEEFLAEGEPPIIFTPGTPNKNFSAFFQKAVQATTAIGARAIILTTFKEQVPQDLPASIRFYKYLPFSQILPRAALLVHHGGIGTMAQAMSAGIPHLVTPWGFDQFDNGSRIKALGIGDVISPQECTAKELADKIRHLLNTPKVLENCQTIQKRMEITNPLQDTCIIIETVARQHWIDSTIKKEKAHSTVSTNFCQKLIRTNQASAEQ